MRTFAVRNRPVKEIVEVVQKMLDLGVLEAEPIGTSKEAGAVGTTPRQGGIKLAGWH